MSLYPPMPLLSHSATRVMVAVETFSFSAMAVYGLPWTRSFYHLPAIGEFIEFRHGQEIAKEILASSLFLRERIVLKSSVCASVGYEDGVPVENESM